MRSMRSMRWDLFSVIGGPCKRYAVTLSRREEKRRGGGSDCVGFHTANYPWNLSFRSCGLPPGNRPLPLGNRPSAQHGIPRVNKPVCTVTSVPSRSVADIYTSSQWRSRLEFITCHSCTGTWATRQSNKGLITSHQKGPCFILRGTVSEKNLNLQFLSELCLCEQKQGVG
jgi:hypothetical protein